MMYYATGKEMERLDALAVESGLDIRQMMELAGWHILGLFDILDIAHDAKVTIVVGKGNKGGDGLSAARHLSNHGWNVSVILLSDKISIDAQHHLNLLRQMDMPLVSYTREKEKSVECIVESDVLIDALIGYHLVGAPRDSFGDVIALMNRTHHKIIAYDIPSGIDATSGECFDPCLRADVTLSLALPKRAFAVEDAKEMCGQIFMADLGIFSALYDEIAQGARPSFEESTYALIPL